MTTTYHTPIKNNAPADDTIFNAPLEQLDQRLTNLLHELHPGHEVQMEGDALPLQPNLVFRGTNISVADAGSATNVAIDRSGFSARHRYRQFTVEFFGQAGGGMLTPLGAFTGLFGGSYEPLASVPGHPGIYRVMSHASNTNSGAYTQLAINTSILISGGENFQIIFRCPTVTDLAHKLGFFDTNSITASVADGVWISIDGAILRGRTSNNSSASQTSSSYTVTADQWYRAKIVVNDDASQVDFYLYDDAGNELWHDHLTSNIPTDAGRVCTLKILGGKTSAGSAAILDVDWLGYQAK